MRAYAIIGMAAAAAEVAQLVLAERVIGVKAIRSGTDPRDLAPPPLWYGRVWFGLLLAIHLYPIGLLTIRGVRGFAFAMMALTIAGYLFRRRYGLRLALVVLTLEGALRIGVILNMIFYSELWRR